MTEGAAIESNGEERPLGQASQPPNAASPLWTARSTFRMDQKDPYLRLHFASIYVRDQERSKRFYLDQLGFSLVIDRMIEPGFRWIEVAPPDGTGFLALVAPRPGSGEESLVGHSGLVTFLTEDVEAKYREWSARGVNFSIAPTAPEWGGVFCRFEDPDGNSFGLGGFDELTRQIEARRQAALEQAEAERRAAQELDIAKQVQARLFPQKLPPMATLDYAGVCIQARSVGGDYYDFLDRGPDRVALVLGDIAGKGIAGALLMANLQANLRSQCAFTECHPQRMLNSVNRLLYDNSASAAYATLFFTEFEAGSGRLIFANCGHLAALVLRRDGAIERLHATCTVVGLFEDWECSMAESQLDPGDTLAIFTDGATESFNAAGEEFGEDRLIDALRRHANQDAHAMAQSIADEVLGFSSGDQHDDITLIIAKRT